MAHTTRRIESLPLPTKASAFWDLLSIVLVFPPVAGYAILVIVLFGEADSAVLGSAAAMCTAMIVAALLILVPPILYIANRDSYDQYVTGLQNLAEELNDDG